MIERISAAKGFRLERIADGFTTDRKTVVPRAACLPVPSPTLADQAASGTHPLPWQVQPKFALGSQAGLTLLEVIVAMGVAGLFYGVLYSFYRLPRHGHSRSKKSSSMSKKAAASRLTS